MAGIKRTTPDDPYSPQGTHNSAKRSKSSLSLRAPAPATPNQERPLHQRTSGWFSFPFIPGFTNILKGVGLISDSETPRATPKRTPRLKGQRRLSICGPSQSRQRLYPDLPQLIDMTKEADEQSDDEPIPGPSRQNQGREITMPDMGRLTIHGGILGAQPRRRERNRKWDRNVDSDGEEEVGHPSRARRHVQGGNSIPMMEDQLARFREIEFQAELNGDEVAQRAARKTAQHFERALRDAKAERDAKRQQERVIVRRHEGDSLINYTARLAALRPQQRIFDRKPEASIPGSKRTYIQPFQQPSDITGLIEKFDRLKKEDDEAFLKSQGPVIPKSLSPEEQAVVKKTFNNPTFKSPLAGTEQVDSRNIGRLKNGQWLADDNISYYLALVSARNASDPQYPKIHAFNSFFYAKIEANGHKPVKRWTKKVDIFSKDLILVPINVGGMHWIAAAINMNKKRIEYFDSMGGYGQAMTDVSETLLQYLQDEHQDKKGSPYDTSDWTFTNAKKAPKQNNGSDCGVFTCQTLELVARGANPVDNGFEFSHLNMPFFRELMTYETATGKLKKRW